MNDEQSECLTQEAQQALQFATDEALALNHIYVGTEHLLLGLLHVRDGVAAQVLNRVGVKLAPTRHAVEFIFGASKQPTSSHLALSARIKQVLVYAQQEARKCDQTCVDTEHLLAGLMHAGDSAGLGILNIMDISTGEIRVEMTHKTIGK